VANNGGQPESLREVLKSLPAVHSVLDCEELADCLATQGRQAVVQAVRLAVDEARVGLRHGLAVAVDAPSLAARARALLERQRRRLRRVLNATGILLHTGLGRAPLAVEAIEAVAASARGYCSLEFELETGRRGRRSTAIGQLLCELTGAEAATVVNNNAGATVLALRALAAGREVLVSRGQLVEIGGSFRLPEILEVSGARLREVGTTNKTRLDDYRRAVNPAVAALLRVHASNFRIVGFTEQPPLRALADLAREHRLLLIDDIGSGALAPGLPPGVKGEPTAAEGIAAGADLVLFSGDKLLGGPQCGIMIGRREVIRRVESDPLMRALRVDKMTLAALEATLELIRDPLLATTRIPLWRMLTTPLPRLMERAEHLAARLRLEAELKAEPLSSESYLGGGSAPLHAIPSICVCVHPPFPPSWSDSATAWAARLRLGDPPVVARIHQGAVHFDLRTVLESEDQDLLDAILRACHDQPPDTGGNGPTPPAPS
jgi:L-seryl-tRNA(Ser) seleniumtransferase